MAEKLEKFWDKISDGVKKAVVLLLIFALPIAGIIWEEVDEKKQKASVRDNIATIHQAAASPEVGPDSAAYRDGKCWPGVDPYRDVYVSKASLTVHDSPHCCGMKYYYTMQAYEAYYYGYRRCQVCW
jgi:hypothetical protein